ncbi:uncharacterized protein [Lepisosteus oculatus]|uniref:uncharacterized protein n=1 Tax=Lepisosteus oculatus TaxID=7918 RepID=UPI003717210C
MRVLCLMLLFQSSVQLHCDRAEEKSTVAGTLTVVCHYKTNGYLYNKKYWCHGESRNWCEILADSDNFVKWEYRGRIFLQDRQGVLLIRMTQLRLDDTGVYWVGIDRPYTDIMWKITIKVTEVPVSRPNLVFLGPAEVSCSGQPLIVRCNSVQGTGVKYTWYKSVQPADVPVQFSTDLTLCCTTLAESQLYYCTASNSVNQEHSDLVRAELLKPAEEQCAYHVTIGSDHSYECWDEELMSTATALISTEFTDGYLPSSVVREASEFNVSVRCSWTVKSLSYEVCRWLLFVALLVSFILLRRYFKLCYCR